MEGSCAASGSNSKLSAIGACGIGNADDAEGISTLPAMALDLSSLPMRLNAPLARSGGMETRLRKKREPETEEQRHARFAEEAHNRSINAAASDAAIDALIRRSIELHGA